MDRFYIGPYDAESGLQTDLKPFVIPESAFSTLNNAYVFRGRVRKRFGSRWFGDTQQQTRLRMNLANYSFKLSGGVGIGITDGAGDATGTIPGGIYQVGQKFVIGAETDTVTNSAPGPQVMTSTGPSIVHTFNISNGDYVLNGAPANTQIVFFPNVTQTSAGGAISGLAPFPAIGQMFSIGSNTYNVYQTGNPANLLFASGTATIATFDTTTGAFIFTGVTANTIIYFYPALPVMGLETYQNSSIDAETLIAFDTKYAYTYTTGWDRLTGETTPGAATWTGSNSDFFWTTTYTGGDASDFVLYVTNFNQLEPNFMRYFFNNQWNNFRPQISAFSAGPIPPAASLIFLQSALILVSFKNRLLAFNTWELVDGVLKNYPQRMRYSALGSPLQADAWRQDIAGRGGGRDCPTEQSIVTVEFVKDRLIVFMEQSTWEIVYTNNQASPFVWQQINSELGAESTFSIVPFDKVAIGVGNVGIIACTGANVDRIDDKIPDTVFDIHIPDQGVERVYGVRDYYTEMIYWAFPATDASATFPYPNRVLVYNYKNGTWAFNDDSFTVFGYYQPLISNNPITWDSSIVTWDDEESWDSGSLTAQFRQVVAGNQEGWTFIINRDAPTNAPSLQITNLVVTLAGENNVVITAIDHNMRVGPTQYLLFQNISGSGNLTLLNDKIFTIATIIDKDNFTIKYFDSPGNILSGDYSGGGYMARVSNIQILTKQYNFYKEKGRNFYINKVDFLVDKTGTIQNEIATGGEIQVNYLVSNANINMLADGLDTNTLLGNGNLETSPYVTVPFEFYSTQVWHPLYIQADGEFIQLNMNLNDEQMRDLNVWRADFQLHSMIFHTSPSSYRLQ